MGAVREIGCGLEAQRAGFCGSGDVICTERVTRDPRSAGRAARSPTPDRATISCGNCDMGRSNPAVRREEIPNHRIAGDVATDWANNCDRPISLPPLPPCRTTMSGRTTLGSAAIAADTYTVYRRAMPSQVIVRSKIASIPVSPEDAATLFVRTPVTRCSSRSLASPKDGASRSIAADTHPVFIGFAEQHFHQCHAFRSKCRIQRSKDPLRQALHRRHRVSEQGQVVE